MHFSNVVPVLGLAAAAVYAESKAACGSVSTVFMTVPGSPVTETFTLTVAATNTQSVSTNAAGVTPTSTDATATTTTYLTATNVISIDGFGSTSADADQGPYSFIVNSGITSWFGGKTPPSTASFITSTAIVTLVPVPESSQVSGKGPKPTASDAPTTTSYTTTLLTTVVSEMHTETLTEPLPSGAVSTKVFQGIGSSGWNVTYTTLVTVKSSEEGSRVVKPYYPTRGMHDGKQLLLPGSALNPPASPAAIKYKHARQVGAVIHATIDGVVVSWTNNYQGSSTTTSTVMSRPAVPMATASLISPVVSSSAVPIYPWQLTSSELVASTVALSDTLTSAFPTTTLPAYPWLWTTSSSQESSVSSNLTSAGSPFGSGWTQPGIPSIQPTANPASSVSIPTVVTGLTTLPTSISRAPNTTTAMGVAATLTASCDARPIYFQLDFDDLPRFSTGPNETGIPPIMNPYYKLFFEAGFGYAPPPRVPFPPVSPPQLAVYRTYDKTDLSPNAGLLLPGEFGAGPRAPESAYWINVFSAYLGCNNTGPASCMLTVNGYNTTSRAPQVSQVVYMPPCPGLVNCHMDFFEFSDEFRNLSGLQILATVEGKPVNWFMDDVALGWSNNTCAAQKERASAH